MFFKVKESILIKLKCKGSIVNADETGRHMLICPNINI